jgi:PHP family Zn ribbon phosphoesterase
MDTALDEVHFKCITPKCGATIAVEISVREGELPRMVNSEFVPNDIANIIGGLTTRCTKCNTAFKIIKGKQLVWSCEMILELKEEE